MIRRLLIVLMASTVLGSAAFGATPTADRPNFVFILIDDLGWSDLGCYGNTFNETRNIDRLAGQGMRFTDAYSACCVCSPTRASIMTGKYPARLHLTDFIPGHLRPWARLTVPKFNQELPLDEITIAEVLEQAGYTSASIGKWHLGGSPHLPDSQGFDVSLVHRGAHVFPRFSITPGIELADGDYLADVLTDHAEKFIEANRDKPFFLYLSHFAVHIPLQAKQELIAKYANKPRPNAGVNHPVYAAMLESADESVGRIMRKLDESGLTERTMVIFTSDNGGLMSTFRGGGPLVTSNAPLRSEKGTQYEGGIRVPMIVRWPGRIESGTTSSVPVSSIDFLPTMLEAAGAKMEPNHQIDGVSLVPILKQTGELARDALYWHYPHYHHGTPAGAIRQGDYKLIERYEDGTRELYNLRDDVGERFKLAGKMPEKAEELSKKLDDWLAAVNAQMPTLNPNYDVKRANEWGKRKNAKPPRLSKPSVFAPDVSSFPASPDQTRTIRGPYTTNVPKSLLGPRGSVCLWFRPAKTILGKSDRLHLINGDAFEMFIDPRDSETWVLFHSGPAMTGKADPDKNRFHWFGAALTHLKADHWYHALWTWDAKNPGRNAFYLDGIWQAGGRPFDFDGQLKASDRDVNMTIGSQALTVSTTSFYRHPIGHSQARHLCERVGHAGYTSEGIRRFHGERFVPADVDWEHPVYETDFDDESALAAWKLEGGLRMGVASGNLVLESNNKTTSSEAKANHLVCWLTREVPADFLLEFTVRPQNRKRGLNIVFFNARGLKGENIFEPPIRPRTGVFKQYTRGDFNNYHISYWSGGRGTANLRKNKGFHLAAIGRDLIDTTPANAFQTVRLYKRGGKIRLTVDDVISVSYDDDGKTYGPVHTHSGWIGLRQMRHTQYCEYGYVKVYPLTPWSRPDVALE